jgi:aryl-alcohol dehydrogenase-like predicted oxidoreductase
MKTRLLGRLEVSAIGLGCMGMSTNYGPSPDRSDLIAFVHIVYDQGVTFFDTAQVYGPFTNEDQTSAGRRHGRACRGSAAQEARSLSASAVRESGSAA